MKELDVLLTQFLDTRYDQLSETGQQTFIHLLEFQDPDLYSWVTGKSQPDDPALVAMLDEINQTRMGVGTSVGVSG